MSHEPEWLTRRTRIDGRLRALGWDVVPHNSSFRPAEAHAQAVVEYPTDHGPADYALFVNGRALGIVEAKRLSIGPRNVLVQAQRYSEGATANPPLVRPAPRALPLREERKSHLVPRRVTKLPKFT